MAEDNVTGDIELLRRVLSALEQRLEALEQWRALRQLDERERNGNPLEGIDGVLFRGRLVQGLAQSSRDWRAYVRVEEAIGHLQGAARLEQGILAVPSRFEAAPAVVAKREPSPAQPNGLASEWSGGDTDAQDVQRLRVKVRAGSLLVSPTPIQAILNQTRPLSNGRGEIPAVAKLSPRPSISLDDMVADQPGDVRASALVAADLRSPRSVLQRIRVIAKSAGPAVRTAVPAGIPEADAQQALLGAPLPPILHEGPELTPQNTGTTGAADQPAAAAGAQHPSVPQQEAGIEPPVTAATGSIAADREQRLDALETELGQLIDKSASWPHPLDARRPVLPTAPSAHHVAPGLEPDTAIELDVDEAEVTIVKLAEPEAPAPRMPIEPPARVKPPRLEPEERLNGEDYAGYRLDLEEASVEIIVPEAAGASNGPSPGKNHRAE